MQIKEIIEATNGQLLSGDMEYDVNGFTQDKVVICIFHLLERMQMVISI